MDNLRFQRKPLSNMPVCIICRCQKTEFNKEHIIPYAVGGKVTVRMVCTDCNNRLGTNVDPHLTDQFLIQMKRFDLGISGRTGSIPDPWIGPAFVKDKGEGEEKVIMKRDKEGRLYISELLSEVEITGSDPITLRIRGGASEFKGMQKKLDKFLKKHNIDRSAITNEAITYSKPDKPGNVVRHFKMNQIRYLMAILKIAYEFTILVIPRYFNDEKAIEISKKLLNCTEDRLPEDTFLGSDKFKKDYLEEIGQVVDFNNDHHFIVLLQAIYGLVCHVKIFDMHHFVLLSKRTDYFEIGAFVVLKNDVKENEAVFHASDSIDYHFSNNLKI